MYGATIPPYDDGKQEKKKEKKINASDPKNTAMIESILFGGKK